MGNICFKGEDDGENNYLAGGQRVSFQIKLKYWNVLDSFEMTDLFLVMLIYEFILWKNNRT